MRRCVAARVAHFEVGHVSEESGRKGYAAADNLRLALGAKLLTNLEPYVAHLRPPRVMPRAIRSCATAKRMSMGIIAMTRPAKSGPTWRCTWR